MAASGVISITAQIMESAEMEGSAASSSSGPSKTFMQKLQANLKGLAGGWKKMAKVGGTGLFYLALSQSKLASGVVKGMLQMVGTIVDLLLDNFGIVRLLGWAIPKMSSAVQKIGDFLQGIGPAFKAIWGKVWDWIASLASSAGDTLLNIFKKIKPESVSSEDVEKLVQERILQLEGDETVVTEAEKQAFLNRKGDDNEPKLINELVFTQEEVEEYAEHYRGQMQTEMDAVRHNAEMAMPDNIDEPQWYHEGGGDLPGGQVTSDHVDAALESGEIVLIDKPLDEEGEGSFYDKASDTMQSWFDDIGSFDFADLIDYFDMPALNPRALLGVLFEGAGGGDSITPKDAVTTILDRSVKDDFKGGSISGYSGNVPDESSYAGSEDYGTTSLNFMNQNNAYLDHLATQYRNSGPPNQQHRKR